MNNKTPQGAALSDADIAERKAAEYHYSTTAFDYVRDPIGSSNWCLFWDGWKARAADRRLTAEQGGADLRDTIREHLTSLYVCTRVWDAWRVGTMTEDDFTPASETDFVEDLAGAIEAVVLTTQPQAEPYKAQPPDYKVQPGTWELRAPDGTSWHEGSPMKCLQAEQRDRIPASVALARIFAAVDEEDAPTAQPQAEPADARIYWHASQGWQVEWLTTAPNGGASNYYRATTAPTEST